jgi:nucleotide-binding universal stress UspA family protein
MKILVPVDGSQNSFKALKYAVNLAKGLTAKSSIVVITVHDDSSFNYINQFVTYEDIKNFLIENSQKELKPAQKLLAKSDVAHSFIIEIGNVSDTILSVADKEKVGMIVIGSKGRSEVSDILLGSVAHRITHKAKQPVLVVK